MFWLAVLVLAVIGINAPRKWLARGLRGATEGTLKFFTFLGAACLILFGLIVIAPDLDFFVALAPAFALWLGVFAVFELGRRRTVETNTTPEPDSREQQSQGSAWLAQAGQPRQSAFEQDPWAVLARRQQAAQAAEALHAAKAAQQPAQTGREPEPGAPPPVLWPLANLLAKPNGKAKPEREDAGMVVFLPEELPAPPAAAAVAETPPPASAPEEPAAKSTLLNVLSVHVAASAAPLEAQETAATTPTASAKPDTPAAAQRDATAKPETAAAAPASSVADKQQSKPAPAKPPTPAGKYKYEPKLVKSLFAKERAD